MGTKVVINQPYYFPRLHWWQRAINCDVVVHLDDVTHNTNFPVNRAVVMDGRYLTIPLPKKQRRWRINEIVLVNCDWIQDHYNKVESYYGAGSAELFESLVGDGGQYLLDVIYSTITNTNLYLKMGLPTEVRSSELRINSAKNDRLIEICRRVNADTLVLGMGSKDYVEAERFKYADSGIEIEYQDWKCPVDDYSILHAIFQGNAKEVVR